MYPDLNLDHLASLVIKKLKSRKSGERLSVSDLENGDQISMAVAKSANRGSQGFDMSDQRWHGAGKGDTGATGPTGETGIQGPTGPTGAGSEITGPESEILFFDSGQNPTSDEGLTFIPASQKLSVGTQAFGSGQIVSPDSLDNQGVELDIHSGQGYNNFNGGNIQILPGAGGFGEIDETPGNGGALQLFSGFGGAAGATGGAGGDIYITANGPASPATSGYGGNIYASAGAAGASAGTGGQIQIVGGGGLDGAQGGIIQLQGAAIDAGEIDITGGQGGTGTSAGGPVIITGGSALGIGAGGEIELIAGTGNGVGGNGGQVRIQSGPTDGLSGAFSGDVVIKAWDGGTASTGGSVYINSGDANGSGDCGNIIVQAGGIVQSGHGVAGYVIVAGGNGATGSKGGDVSIYPGIANATGVAGDVALGAGTTGPSRTSDFVYIPTSLGTAAGVPSGSFSGRIPLVFDTVNNKLWIYNSGWKSATFS